MPPVGSKSAFFFTVLFFFLAFILFFHSFQLNAESDERIQLNIHLKVNTFCQEKAIFLNKAITELDPTQKIDFIKTYEPHVTLFLTSFNTSTLEKLKNVVGSVVERFPSECQVSTLDSLACSSSYILWNNTLNDCIQLMSDLIVNNTKAFVHPYAKTYIPKWVYEMPNKDELIHNIHEYGSPNVFHTFSPHITVAYDDNDNDHGENPSRILQACLDVSSSGIVKTCSYTAFQLGVTPAGPYGTVPRHKEIALYPIPK